MNERFLVTLDDGSFSVRGHPGWRVGDTPETGRPLTADELVDAGFGKIIVETPLPAYDPLRQECALAPASHWIIGERTAEIVFTVTDLSFSDYKANKLAALSELRKQAVEGGVAFGGTTIRTDGESRSNITGGVSLFDNDPTLSQIDWEAQPGVWVTIDEATMRAIGIAVGRHVQACFTRARTLSALIATAEDTAALVAIDLESGWP